MLSINEQFLLDLAEALLKEVNLNQPRYFCTFLSDSEAMIGSRFWHMKKRVNNNQSIFIRAVHE